MKFGNNLPTARIVIALLSAVTILAGSSCESRRECKVGEWAPLEVKSLSPPSASRTGGSPVLVWISSSRYGGETGVQVEIGGVGASFSSAMGPFSGTLWALSITTPALPPGKHDVQVRLPAGEVHTLARSYGAVPVGVSLAPTSSIFGYSSPTQLDTGDSDGDGRCDLFVVHGALGQEDRVALLLGGNGNFTPGPDTDAGNRVDFCVASDLDSDGRADFCLATAPPSQPPLIRIYLSKNGSPLHLADFPTVNPILDMLLRDVDQVPGPDLILLSGGIPSVESHLNDGQGGFTHKQSLPLANTPFSLTSSRIDPDDLTDLAVSDPVSGSILLLSGLGNGTFTPPVSAGPAPSPSHLKVGDLTRDGLPDLVVASSLTGVAILVNDGTGQFGQAGQVPTALPSDFVRLLDYDLDGSLDILVVSDDALALYCGDGTGSVLPGRELHLTFSSPLAGVDTMDVNGDGLPDILVSEPALDLIWICLNTSL
ncbi:MAG: FG-GAP repeat domain-containing protein [Planctomycetota bacterium]|jgi:hypothetical protein